MDSIKIYSSDGALLIDAVLEDSSAQDWGIMSENQVSLDFYTDECIILPASCYIDYEGQRFWLLDEYKPTENNSAEWSYQVRFLGAESLLALTVVLNQTDGSDEPIFNLTAPASQHLEFIVSNLNRRFPGMGWSVGSVPSTENIFIEYAGTYASDALQTIVGDKYEWWVDDFVVNVGRCEFGERIELGYQNGLLGGITYSTANEMRSYAYLYPIGSTRNIDPSKYGYSRLQLPDGLTRIDINPEQGLAELVESDAFADIFPRYVGKVTAVRTSSGKNEDGTSFTIYHIKDSSIPFNPNNYEIAGEVKQITFQSGELMGAEFEVNYDADNKEFEIITQFQNGGLSQLPGGALIPKVGDKYVVWNISMPDEYYPLAEQEFLQAALAFASESVKEASVYRAPVDFIEVQQRGLRLRPGQRVRLLSNEYFPDKGYYDSRITRITRDVCYPDEITIEVSSVVSKGTISRLRNSVNDSATKVASLGQSLKNYVDITSAQSIFGVKNFFNGLTIAGIKMYKHVDGYVYLDAPLVLKGGLTMYGDDGTAVPSIFDAIPIDNLSIVRNNNKALSVNVDGRTIKLDGNGALYVDETALSISGGGGGGGVADSVHWNNVTGKPSWIGSTKPTYKYSEIEEKPDLSVYAKLSDIPSLNGYATQSWVENKGYLLATTASSTYQPKITSSNKLAYSLISGTPDLSEYFLKSSFTKANIKSTLGISDWALASAKPTYKYSEIGNTPDLSVYALNTDLAKKWTQNDAKIANWDSAYSWGNHANAGYAKASDVTNEFKNYVKLAGNTQSITAQHDFANGLKIGGLSLRKVDDYLYLDSSLVLSGGVTMYGDDGTTVKPIWESIPFDRTTIDWVNGQWTVVGGVGGSGISEDFLNTKLQGYQPLLSTSNKLPYSLISGTPDLSVFALKSEIPSLNGYATQTWVENKGYLLASTASSTYQPKITSSNKLAYSLISGTPDLSVYALKTAIPTKLSQLTDDVVAGNYLPLSGGSMTGSITTRSNVYSWANAKTVGHIIAGHNAGGSAAPIISTALASGGYGKLAQVSDQFGLYAYSASDSTPSVRLALYPEDGAIKIMGNTIPVSTTTYNLGSASAKWSNVYATSFIGNLTGNADSATDASNLTQTTYTGDVNADDLYGSKSRVLKLSTNANLPVGMNYGNILYIGGGDTGFMLAGSYSRDKLLFRRGTNKNNAAQNIHTNSWKEIAFTDSNVASATKLATARTIWGQSFDGTGDVDGDMLVNGKASVIYRYGTSADGAAILSVGAYKSNPYGLIFYSNGAQASSIQSQLFDNSLYTTLCLNHKGGNVAIGGTTADAKLHVHGTAKFTGDTTFSSKVVIGTIPVYQSADGTLFVDANVVFRGGVAMYGDTTTTINEE